MYFIFRDSALPLDMKPLPREPEDEKKRKQKTPKSKNTINNRF